MPGVSAPDRLTSADCERAATWGSLLEIKTKTDVVLIAKYTMLAYQIRVRNYKPVDYDRRKKK